MNEALLSQFQFIDFRLDRLVFYRAEGASADNAYDLSVQFDTRVAFEEIAPESTDTPEQEEPEKNEQNILDSFVTLFLTLAWAPSPGPFHFELALTGHFQRHVDMPPESFTQFSEVLAPALLFSQARPIVRSVMNDAKEQFRLPLINVPESIRQKQSVTSSAHTDEQSE